MRRIFLAILFLFSVSAWAESALNHTGYGDTCAIHGFRADSLKYSKAYSLTDYEALRVTVFVDDTSSAGFDSDSLLFAWGIQTGTPVLNSSGGRDTLWNPLCLVVDTLDLVDDATIGLSYGLVGTDGTYSDVLSLIDTLSVSGWAAQSRVVTPRWDVYFRGWFQGLTGNITGSFAKLWFAPERRRHQKVSR